MPHVDIYVMNLGYTSFKSGVYTEERRIEYNNALSNLTKTLSLNIINVSNVKLKIIHIDILGITYITILMV